MPPWKHLGLVTGISDESLKAIGLIVGLNQTNNYICFHSEKFEPTPVQLRSFIIYILFFIKGIGMTLVNRIG